MRNFGLIGYPLKHSFSKSYFEKKFNNLNIKDSSYTNFEIKNNKVSKSKAIEVNILFFKLFSIPLDKHHQFVLIHLSNY